MKPSELQNLFTTKQIKKGRFYTIVYGDSENGYERTIEIRVRFVHYYNMASTIAQGKVEDPSKANPNSQNIIKDVLTFNTKTNNYLLHCALRKNSQAKVSYKYQGQAIDQATYENAIPTKHNHGSITNVMTIKLDRVIEIR